MNLSLSSHKLIFDRVGKDAVGSSDYYRFVYLSKELKINFKGYGVFKFTGFSF